MDNWFFKMQLCSKRIKPLMPLRKYWSGKSIRILRVMKSAKRKKRASITLSKKNLPRRGRKTFKSAPNLTNMLNNILTTNLKRKLKSNNQLPNLRLQLKRIINKLIRIPKRRKTTNQLNKFLKPYRNKNLLQLQRRKTTTKNKNLSLQFKENKSHQRPSKSKNNRHQRFNRLQTAQN